jgi:uncharacterized protein YjiS (DUF1127 family)
MIDSEISLMRVGHVWRRRLSAIGLVFYKTTWWVRDEIRRTVVIGELIRLNDHYLDDVGINRSDIESIADTMVRGMRENRNRTRDQDDAMSRPMLVLGNITRRRRVSKGVHS